jgi:hypothetical protein
MTEPASNLPRQVGSVGQRSSTLVLCGFIQEDLVKRKLDIANELFKSFGHCF